MAHTFHAQYIHLVFSTKRREKFLVAEIRDRLWKIMSGILTKNDIKPIAIGGYDDHCHALIKLPPHRSASQAAKLLKGASSKWLSETYSQLEYFSWQVGYSVFSVSPSQLSKVITYINNQEDHHKKVDFEQEYKAFIQLLSS